MMRLIWKEAALHDMTYDLKQLRDRFFTDPMWKEMEELIEEYLAPMRDSDNIPDDLSNDQIASEVRGRKLLTRSLDKFLADVGVISGRIRKDKQSYK